MGSGWSSICSCSWNERRPYQTPKTFPGIATHRRTIRYDIWFDQDTCTERLCTFKHLSHRPVERPGAIGEVDHRAGVIGHAPGTLRASNLQGLVAAIHRVEGEEHQTPKDSLQPPTGSKVKAAPTWPARGGQSGMHDGTRHLQS